MSVTTDQRVTYLVRGRVGGGGGVKGKLAYTAYIYIHGCQGYGFQKVSFGSRGIEMTKFG